jgi:hypothetical protein
VYRTVARNKKKTSFPAVLLKDGLREGREGDGGDDGGRKVKRSCARCLSPEEVLERGAAALGRAAALAVCVRFLFFLVWFFVLVVF